ncbi:synaptic vesicle 2-related protein-like [Clytia hemisphaerica]|uniref:Major facilitator superfamily (MFS) profile domain-containing protein n=1 Tax=Clytia hemisphaerica TaxID=252671 RepID=A0A7M5WLE6_9CNID
MKQQQSKKVDNKVTIRRKDKHVPILIEELIDYYGFGKHTIKMVFLLSCVCFAYGALTNILANVILINWACEPGDRADEPQLVWATLCIGLALGSFYFGWLADRYGRKLMIAVTTTLSLYFTLLLCASESHFDALLILFFTASGLSGGRIISNYSAESFPVKHRARIQTVLGLSSSLGSVVYSYLAYTQRLGWRHFTLTASAPLIVFIVIPFWLPESIPYLQMTGNEDELYRVFQHLAESHGKNLKRRTLLTARTIKNRGNLPTLFSKSTICGTLIVMLLWATSRLSMSVSTVLHYNTIVFNKTTCPENQVDILQSLSFKEVLNCKHSSDVFYVSFIGSLAESIGLAITFIFINHVSRRFAFICLLLINSAGFIAMNICSVATIHTALVLITMATSASFFQVLCIFTNEFYHASVRCTATGMFNFISLLALVLIPILISLSFALTPIVVTVFFVSFAVLCCFGLWWTRIKTT